MEFNITNLDKILLLQTLYVHADPKGYGTTQYRQLLKQGKTVEGLPMEECEDILKGRYRDSAYLVDYYNGKPIKLDWVKAPEGQLIARTLPYDVAHGKYRFLEALLNVFDAEEIRIVKKEYPRQQEELFFKKEDTRIIEYELRQLLDHTVPFRDKTGAYWIIDNTNNTYRSAFLNGLEI
jgi:hypothetical protein